MVAKPKMVELRRNGMYQLVPHPGRGCNQFTYRLCYTRSSQDDGAQLGHRKVAHWTMLDLWIGEVCQATVEVLVVANTRKLFTTSVGTCIIVALLWFHEVSLNLFTFQHVVTILDWSISRAVPRSVSLCHFTPVHGRVHTRHTVYTITSTWQIGQQTHVPD